MQRKLLRKCPLGRPRCENDTKMELKEIGCGDVNCMRIILNDRLCYYHKLF
jgi:hypothetical protein